MSGPSEHVSIADREIAARKRRDEALAILASLPATAVAEAPICLGDPDVTLFFAVAYGRMHPADARNLCRKRFGDDRTPSRAALSRFWRRLGVLAAYQDKFGGDEVLAAEADLRASIAICRLREKGGEIVEDLPPLSREQVAQIVARERELRNRVIAEAVEGARSETPQKSPPRWPPV